jgi:hypothetical protein
MVIQTNTRGCVAPKNSTAEGGKSAWLPNVKRRFQVYLCLCLVAAGNKELGNVQDKAHGDLSVERIKTIRGVNVTENPSL